MKKVVISEPFQENILPFQKPIYDVAVSLGFNYKRAYHIPRILHYAFFHFPINFYLKILDNNQEARIVLVSGTHIEPMIYPNAYSHEIIPIIWDCWPQYMDIVARTLKRCCVRIAFFSSSQVACRMAKRLPNIDCLFLPEAAVKDLYFSGDKLVNRRINILEFGRSNGKIHDEIFEKKIKSHYFPLNNKHLFHTSEEFAKALSDSKIAIVLPRNMTHPQIACGIETLTQRYWECMFSRCLMVGHAPDELVNLIGYNPVIEISNDNAGQQVSNIINNIEEYQSLVDKNYEIACQYGDWNSRLVELSNILNNRGYLLR